jgi:VanZ family protein
MLRIFPGDSNYRKKARAIAIVWTLLIFIGCFTPGKDIPSVSVPFADKWVHLVLFGGFTFLWLCTYRAVATPTLFIIFFISVSLGSFIELMQGLLTFLGRALEFLDAVADSAGGLSGIGLFVLAARMLNRK